MPPALSKDTQVIVTCGATGCAVLLTCWVLSRRKNDRGYSYPGDAIPKEKQLERVATFKTVTHRRRVDCGWTPVVEAQPENDLLPHKVSGQQVWAFCPSSSSATADAKQGGPIPFDPAHNPNAGDKIFRAARLKAWVARGVSAAAAIPKGPPALVVAAKGFDFYRRIQCDDGQWAGDYGGPHFLLPGLVIAAYISGGLTNVLPQPYWKAAEVYIRNHQQVDGGWGTHIESPSTLFGSILNYVALRLLGGKPEDPACVQGRAFVQLHGGALKAPSWAKFWLTVLGVYEYDGLAPLSPELWMLPYWFPIHPGRFWCHCRMVYLPMSYLYGKRFSYDAASDETTLALRRELYPGLQYADIQWSSHWHDIADIDNYSSIHWTMRTIQSILGAYEYLGSFRPLRRASLHFVEEYIHAEDAETNYLTIGPVSKALHLLCSWVMSGNDQTTRGSSKAFRAHVARVHPYLWVAEDGLKMQGYNGSMAWDTSFALQAVVEGDLQNTFPEMASRAWSFMAKEQVRALPHGDWRHFRQAIRGGWGFSTAEQAWPVSDTTGEAFSAVLCLWGQPCVAHLPQIPVEHLYDTVEYLLTYQNGDGGWATYENCRGWGWYELLNPSEVFGDIMIDYSYVECSTSSMKALMSFSRLFPDHRPREIQRAVRRGTAFIKRIQRDDGSWFGCWGNCFTYGCWFGVEGLLCGGADPATDSNMQRCVEFLLRRQNADGGWGEDFASCFNREYAARDKLPGSSSGSSVVQTAWALLALMAAECQNTAAVERGIQLLSQRQQPNGDWLQENIAGVFNRSVGITYTAFRNVFPLWALGRFAQQYGPRHGLVPPAA